MKKKNKKKHNVSYILFLLIGIIPITTTAKPIINEKYEYYTVNPKSAEGLIRALNKVSPLQKKMDRLCTAALIST